MREHEEKAEARIHMSQYHYFKFIVSILLNENRTKIENETEYMNELKRKREKIIVVMASRRRAMK